MTGVSIMVRHCLLFGVLGCALIVLAVPAQALAAEGKPPVIESLSEGIGGEITVGGRINPEGLETTYEIRLECSSCDPSDQRVQEVLAAGYGGYEVRLTLTGLQPGIYRFGVLAKNSAGEAFQRGQAEVPQVPPGACPDGCPPSGPYETHLEPWVGESAQKFAEGAPAREAERQAKAAKEREEREAALAKADQPIATPMSSSSTTATGGVTLADTSIEVQKNGMALMKLNCLGIETCHGKLTLTAKGAVEARGAKGEKVRSVLVGTVSYSVAGDETKPLDVKLDGAGRALLSAGHGRCGASLAILELAPAPENTQTKSVQLVQRQAVKARRPAK